MKAATHLLKSSVRLSISRGIHKQQIGVIGVPFNMGQQKSGVEEGPKAMRETKFIENLQHLGHTVRDYGDIVIPTASTNGEPSEGMVRNCSAVSEINKKLSDSMQRILKENTFCLTLGGDHSVAIGSVHGHAQVHPDLCLLWIDAHSDINTATTTNSGNMHGMSASFHLRELQQFNRSLKEMQWLDPSLSGREIAYVGLRDVEPLEKLIIEKLGIKAFCMDDVDRLGIRETVARALDSINASGKKSLHVSFDVDSLDVQETPSTGTPVPGGLTLREGLAAAEEIYRSGFMRALDIVEVNPKVGTQDDIHKTLLNSKKVLLSFFGSVRGGNVPCDIRDIPEKTRAGSRV